jgi:putative chitinase
VITVGGTGAAPTPPPAAPAPSPTQTTAPVTTTTAPVTTTPPPASTTITYTVVAGDTLGKIAARHTTTVAAIAAANGIANVNLIRVGQKLTIATSGTTAAPTPPPAATTITYTVVAGDTLSTIAAKYHTTVTAIAVANKIKNVNLIRVGQQLTISAG